jgi:hypothetical protein
MERHRHAALLSMPDVVLRELLARVRPLIVEAAVQTSRPPLR